PPSVWLAGSGASAASPCHPAHQRKPSTGWWRRRCKPVPVRERNEFRATASRDKQSRYCASRELSPDVTTRHSGVDLAAQTSGPPHSRGLRLSPVHRNPALPKRGCPCAAPALSVLSQ